MAVTILVTPQIVIGGVDLTNRIDTVTLEETFADVDTTAFGSTSKTRVAGLGDHKFSASFQQDFATSEVEQTIYPLIGTTTSVSVLAGNSGAMPGSLFRRRSRKGRTTRVRRSVVSGSP